MKPQGEERARDGVRRVRERFQPDRDWPPVPVLVVIGLGGLALILFFPLPLWARGVFFFYLLVYLYWMLQSRLRTPTSDYVPFRRAPAGRRIVRPEAWEELAREEGLEFGGGREPWIRGEFEGAEVELRLTRSHREGGPGRAPVRVSEARARGASGVWFRIRPGEPEEEVPEGPSDFDRAYRLKCGKANRRFAEILLDEELRGHLLRLGDARVDAEHRIRVWTPGFETDPERIRSLLTIAAHLGRSGPAALVPADRREVRGEIWEDFALRAGMESGGGETPWIRGRYSFAEMEMRYGEFLREYGPGGKRLPVTEVRGRPRVVSSVRVRPRGPEERERLKEEAELEAFDRAYRVTVSGPDNPDDLLDAEAKDRLIELEDVRVDAGPELFAWTPGFESDPARIERLLQLVAHLCRPRG